MKYLYEINKILDEKNQIGLIIRDIDGVELFVYYDPEKNHWFLDDKKHTAMTAIIQNYILYDINCPNSILPEKIRKKQDTNINFLSTLVRETLSYKLCNTRRYQLEDFQVPPGSIACKNGILDFKTGSLIPYSKETKVLFFCPSKYQPNITEPPEILEEFISEILYQPKLSKPKNQELVDFYYTVEGAQLTGELLNNRLFMYLGASSSGKTTSQNLIQGILGSYYTGAIDSRILTKNSRSNSPIRPELLANRDARQLFASESSEDWIFDSVLLKKLIGRDTISCRNPRGKTIDFIFNGSIRFAAQYMPKIDNINDETLIDKIIVFDFPNTIPQNKRDPKMLEKLMEQRDNIFSFFCNKAIELYQKGNIA